MPTLLADSIGLLLANLLSLVFMLLPGFGLIRLARTPFSTMESNDRTAWSLVAPAAFLPLLWVATARVVGLPLTMGVGVALALVGLRPALAAARNLRHSDWGIIALWWVIVAGSFVDFQTPAGLHQPILVLDLVKHAAVVDSIANAGLPLHDPFFARDAHAGYYYYFYVAGAMIERAGNGLIDARMAFAATAFCTVFSLPALLWLLARACRPTIELEAGRERSFILAACLLVIVTGFDLPAMLALHLLGGPLEPHIDWWGDEISFALTSLLWVPHHLSGVIAGFSALTLISHTIEEPRDRSPLAWAAVALASTFGLSLWVAVGFALTIILWLAWRLLDRQPTPWIPLIASGAGALALCLPQLLDLLSGREAAQFPLGLWVRPFWAGAPEHAWLRLLLLPLSWALEFGIFAMGGMWIAQRWRATTVPVPPATQLMIAAALTGLVANGFVRSTVINNDFGWRVIWLAQMPAMLGTALALSQIKGTFRAKPAVRAALVLGILGSIWSLTTERLLRPHHSLADVLSINADPAQDAALRAAYSWAKQHLPRRSIVQHNPAQHPRSFAFGLYGHNRPAVADGEAMLFGASETEVRDRINALKHVFDGSMSADVALSTARRMGIDYLLLQPTDMLWQKFSENAPGKTCSYRSVRICIVPTDSRGTPP